MKRFAFPVRETVQKSRNRRQGEIASASAGQLEHPEQTAASSLAQQAEYPERPTTFQLAELAAILATRPDAAQTPPAEVVLEALQLWDEALKVNLREQQEREMWSALYSDAKEQWEQRLKYYIGDKFGLYELLSDPRFQLEAEVLPSIFPDQAETPQSRREKFAHLLHYAQEHQLLVSVGSGIHPELKGLEEDETARQLQVSPDGEDLLGRKFNALVVRRLVEAQQQRTAQAGPRP